MTPPYPDDFPTLIQLHEIRPEQRPRAVADGGRLSRNPIELVPEEGVDGERTRVRPSAFPEDGYANGVPP